MPPFVVLRIKLASRYINNITLDLLTLTASIWFLTSWLSCMLQGPALLWKSWWVTGGCLWLIRSRIIIYTDDILIISSLLFFEEHEINYESQLFLFS